MSEKPDENNLETDQDKRKFLIGAAAAAVAAGVGSASGAVALPPSAYGERNARAGLVMATTYMRADQIAGNPYVKAYPELAHRAYIPGYGFAELPIPTEPGALFAHSIKNLVGALVRCICIVPDAMLGFGGDRVTTHMEGGVAVSVGGGSDNVAEKISSVILHPGEHISRGINDVLGAIFVDHDTGRPLLPSLIIPIDLETIWNQMIRLVNPANWGEIIGNTLKNPFSILNEVFRFFFPVRQEMNFNVNVTCAKFPGMTLINKENIKVDNPNLSSFPPKNAKYNTSGIVELIDASNPKGGTVCTINKWQPTVDHRKNLDPFTNHVPGQGQRAVWPKQQGPGLILP